MSANSTTAWPSSRRTRVLRAVAQAFLLVQQPAAAVVLEAHGGLARM